MQFAIDQLKRVVDEFEEFDLFIVSPVTRYVGSPCCTSLDHVTNFGDPEFLSTIIGDLTKMKFHLRKKLQPAVVIDGIELVCGSGCGREKVEQTLRAGWALDPVHPTGHIYAKMALNLIERVANPAGKPDSRKRKRSDDTASGSGSQHIGTPQQARPHSYSGQDRPRDPATHRNPSPATSTVSTANTGRTTEHSPQLPIRTSTADAGTQVRSPVAGCPVSNSVHQPDPEEAEITAASAADSAAASGTGGRPRGAPVRGFKKKSVFRPPTHQDDGMQVN
jgi:hypothetical protein